MGADTACDPSRRRISYAPVIGQLAAAIAAESFCSAQSGMHSPDMNNKDRSGPSSGKKARVSELVSPVRSDSWIASTESLNHT